MNSSLVRRALLTTVFLLLAAGAALATPQVMSHQVQAVFDVPANHVALVDRLLLPAGVDYLLLGPKLQVVSLAGPSGPADLNAVLSAQEDEDGPFQRVDLASLGLAENGGELSLTYGGTFLESVENTVFSRENVGGEITATISDEGIYLSAGAGWLAWHPDIMATHTISSDTPAGFESVTQGARTRHETVGDRLLITWEAPYPSDGLNFIAHRFVVHEEPVREGIVSYTFFLEDDPRLRATYMERTRAYIAMYEEMIGPYPYSKFATVENWFPTGYGMPSYTLLGGQVLRLPFIPYTSFGHEIAHNWWGNSIFVDADQGNWCEGLTAYCADYHYKDLDSPTGAYEYRRNALKDYAAYVHDPSLDFPLSEFKSRHSGATRAVGYGKSMMVFHMIEELVGRETFLAGMQKVAAEHQYAKTTWSDFFAAFSQLSGQDLGKFQQQWLTRTGAARLDVEDVEFKDDKVVFKLRQGAPPYDLQVPIVVKTAAGDQEHRVHFDKVNQKFEIEARGARVLSVDPGCDLFRHLHPAEIEPTISQVLGVEVPAFVLDSPDEAMTEAARNFARSFSELEEGFYFNRNGMLVEDTVPGSIVTNVVINPGPALLKRFLPGELMVSGKTFFLDGKRYNLGQQDLVFAAANPDDPRRTDLVILCGSADRLESLARRVVHYGKYSWLIMPAGQGPVIKGNWELSDSQLVVGN
jgi:aminopeptidase N